MRPPCMLHHAPATTQPTRLVYVLPVIPFSVTPIISSSVTNQYCKGLQRTTRDRKESQVTATDRDYIFINFSIICAFSVSLLEILLHLLVLYVGLRRGVSYFNYAPYLQ